MKEDRPILAYAARMHEEGRRFLLTEMKKAGLDELTTSCGDTIKNGSKIVKPTVILVLLLLTVKVGSELLFPEFWN